MYILTLSLTEHWHRLHLETRLAQPVQQTRCPHGTNTTPMSASRQILHVLAAFRRLFSTSMSHGNLSRQPLPANAAVTVVSQNSHRKKPIIFHFHLTINQFSRLIPPLSNTLQCSDTVGWATEMASLSLFLRFNGHFPGEPGSAGAYWSKGWWR